MEKSEKNRGNTNENIKDFSIVILDFLLVTDE
jgi:hypothetical protein